MALDRQSIEKRDFPIGRRGYEPEAVDAHLTRVAEEVEALRRSAATPTLADATPASMAKAASEQVRAIVEAAEISAAEIERAAVDEAARVREEAQDEARRTRDDAVTQSQNHIDKVRQATTQMLQRVDAMETELTGLIESLRTGAHRLTADLSLLEGGMGELYDVSGRDRRPSGPPVVESVPAVVASDPTLAHGHQPAEDIAAAEEPEVADAPAPDVAHVGGDVEGARLVALNMALTGTARDETDRYLAENFDLPDRDALLDEVYATVES